MAAAQTQLSIRPACWDRRNEELVRMAAPDAVADIRRQVEGNTARLFAVDIDGDQVAAFVLRVDQFEDGPQGVIVAAAGDGGGIDLVGVLLPYVEALFGPDVVSVRVHTGRPGLAKRLARQGYRLTELVLEKGINHGR